MAKTHRKALRSDMQIGIPKLIVMLHTASTQNNHKHWR